MMKTELFIKQSEILAPVERVFAFHERADAFRLLTPPWERVEIIEQSKGIEPGARVVVKTFIGPFSRLWIAEHIDYVKDSLFTDLQRSGPFAYWHHRHKFEATQRNTTIYTDEIEYRLPLGWAGRLIGGRFVQAKLNRLFDYRHRVVAEKTTDML